MADETPRILVDATGRPARPTDRACPRCGAAADQRVRTAGFGPWHDLCPCGHEFPGEQTAS